MTDYEKFAKTNKEQLIEFRNIVSLVEELNFLKLQQYKIEKELNKRFPGIYVEEEKPKQKMINGVII